MTQAQIGVFGGSGFYSLLEDAETFEVDTPYGEPSAPPVIGSIGSYRVAFIPRHGVKHQFPPRTDRRSAARRAPSSPTGWRGS